MLELGAGFQPDLSGRDNIFLNGSLLGLSRADIEKRYDDIVAFAELEEFIDNQVKFYSSGMYVAARVRGGGQRRARRAPGRRGARRR